MSYCTVAEIGKRANIRHVQTAAKVIENETSPFSLYKEQDTWQLTTVRISQIGDEVRLFTLYPVIGHVDLSIYNSSSALIDNTSVNAGSEGTFIINIPADFYRPGFDMTISAVRGRASVQDGAMADASQFVPGATIVRKSDNSVILIESEFTENKADYNLVVPPPDLKTAAIVIGRRSYRLERDDDSDFDGNMKFGGLADNLDAIFKGYILR